MNRNPRQILTELLVLRAQGGNDQAFSDLHELWRADVVRVAQVTVQDRGAAIEISQDAWITIARGLGTLRDPACFPRWLFQIVRRRAADWIRRQQKQRLVVSRLEAEPRPVSEPSPDAMNSPLAQAIEDLPLAERELITLYYEVGRSVPEIAEILNVPVGTVKSRLHSVRARLKSQIEKETS
ncbi:MAG: sigma-70 family RNA polymerase sigma factor [Synoicihabitans sp.]